MIILSHIGNVFSSSFLYFLYFSSSLRCLYSPWPLSSIIAFLPHSQVSKAIYSVIGSIASELTCLPQCPLALFAWHHTPAVFFSFSLPLTDGHEMLFLCSMCVYVCPVTVDTIHCTCTVLTFTTVSEWVSVSLFSFFLSLIFEPTFDWIALQVNSFCFFHLLPCVSCQINHVNIWPPEPKWKNHFDHWMSSFAHFFSSISLSPWLTYYFLYEFVHAWKKEKCVWEEKKKKEKWLVNYDTNKMDVEDPFFTIRFFLCHHVLSFIPFFVVHFFSHSFHNRIKG